jgi:hypothetical protein
MRLAVDVAGQNNQTRLINEAKRTRAHGREPGAFRTDRITSSRAVMPAREHRLLASPDERSGPSVRRAPCTGRSRELWLGPFLNPGGVPFRTCLTML